jgi:hypothetical protein
MRGRTANQVSARKVAGRLAAIAAIIPVLAFSFAPSRAAFAQSGGTVVADGLTNPGPVAIGDDGSIYVAESGTGGSEKITTPGENGQPGESGTRGYTAQITKIAPDGTKTVVAKNLPSIMGGEGPSGASDLAYANGALWAVWYGTPEGVTPIPGEGALLRIDPSTGISQTVASITGFEVKNNPDPNAVDSNPYGVSVGSDNMVYVADAGGNDVLKVDPNSGAVSLVAVIPGIPVPKAMQQPGGNPERGGKQELDPVPTGVQMGADGALYVSLLSGGPFPPGAAKIERVTLDGKVTDAVTGLTMLTDIKPGPDGSWYVNQFNQFDLSANPPGPVPGTGQVLRIGPGGDRQVILTGLNFVQKIAVDAEGNVIASVGPQVMRFAPMPGVTPGMPRTGQDMSADLLYVAAFGMLLLAAGAGVRKFAVRRSS